MLTLLQSDPAAAAIVIALLVVSFTLHELAHAAVAVWEGDRTPELEGRVTLNPLKHIDPIGFVLIIVAGFGWARPVSTRPERYRHGRAGEVAVSLAGVAANLLVAAACLAVAAFVLNSPAPLTGATRTVARAAAIGLQLNLLLAVFNALPVPPLDGAHVVGAILPPGARVAWNRLANSAGLWVILVLVLIGPPVAQATGAWTASLLGAFTGR